MKKCLILMTAAIFMYVFGAGGPAFGATVAGDPLLNPALIEEIESTDKSGADGTLITGTKGTDTYAPVWNADGDIVDGPGVPAVVALSNLASVAINLSLVSDAANTDDLGTEAIFWKKLYLASEVCFEGSADDAHRTTLSVTNPTGTRTITMPDSDQTVGLATSAATDAIDAITEIAAALKSGADATLITGTKGTSGHFAEWNADGDLVSGGEPGNPGSFGAGGSVTAAGGIVTAGTTNYLIIDGEGGVADEITEIVADAIGDILVIKAVDDSTTITMKDGTYLKLQADFIMDNGDDSMVLLCTTLGANDVFMELSRANNGA